MVAMWVSCRLRVSRYHPGHWSENQSSYGPRGTRPPPLSSLRVAEEIVTGLATCSVFGMERKIGSWIEKPAGEGGALVSGWKDAPDRNRIAS